MDGDDIKWSNESLPRWPKGMPLWQKVLCLFGYHKRETRRTGPNHMGFWDAKPQPLPNMKLRDQCGRCHTLLD
jgi:hypothetical protein